MVGVVIALAFVSLIGWQAVVAAHVWQAAHASARTAARAGLVGAPVKQAALTVLPDYLATRATVSVTGTADARRVRVALLVPRVVSRMPGLRVAGEARIDP